MRKTGISMAALIAVVGLMILAAPAEFIKVIVILLGIVLLINGVLNILKVSSLLDDSYFKRDVLIRGWTSVIIGLLAIALPLVFAATMWTIMLYILAVYLLMSAGMELYAINRMVKKDLFVKYYVIEVIITILFAVLLFIIPGKIGILLVRIIGVIFLLSGLSLSVYFLKEKPVIVEPDSVTDDENKTEEENKEPIEND